MKPTRCGWQDSKQITGAKTMTKKYLRYRDWAQYCTCLAHGVPEDIAENVSEITVAGSTPKRPTWFKPWFLPTDAETLEADRWFLINDGYEFF